MTVTTDPYLHKRIVLLPCVIHDFLWRTLRSEKGLGGRFPKIDRSWRQHDGSWADRWLDKITDNCLLKIFVGRITVNISTGWSQTNLSSMEGSWYTFKEFVMKVFATSLRYLLWDVLHIRMVDLITFGRNSEFKNRKSRWVESEFRWWSQWSNNLAPSWMLEKQKQHLVRCHFHIEKRWILKKCFGE